MPVTIGVVVVLAATVAVDPIVPDIGDPRVDGGVQIVAVLAIEVGAGVAVVVVVTVGDRTGVRAVHILSGHRKTEGEVTYDGQAAAADSP